MPRSLADAHTRAEVTTRLASLTPADTARWGRFNAPRMLAHVTDALRMAVGDLPCEAKDIPFAKSFPLKQLIIYWLPFPKGTPTAPELLARAPAPWAEELAACSTLLERFVPGQGPRQWPAHPAFGQMNEREWGVLAYRHLDHHLRQFGR